MLINQGIAVSTSSILLVPYSASHVPEYHEWMKDAEIQELTASEPLSLEEEYKMQKSWRTDGDKLTFIVCLPLLPPASSHQSGKIVKVKAGEESMVGDVNLFLSPPDDEDEEVEEKGKGICTGELELMIAQADSRRKGYGRGAILTFMSYIENHLEEILDEFSGVKGRWKGLQLKVKIGGENEKSIGLFESIGFVRVGEGVNYFGEVELRFASILRVGGGAEEKDRLRGLGESMGVGGYKEVVYEEEEGS